MTNSQMRMLCLTLTTIFKAHVLVRDGKISEALTLIDIREKQIDTLR